jgi:hypothetical protein
MIVRTCKCGNVGIPCGICNWQTSILQPSQGTTTQIPKCLFSMAILYMKNDFQPYVYCFHRRSVGIVSVQESQAVIEDSTRHTAVLSRAIACFILVQSVQKTYEKVSFDERVIFVPASPFSDKCMALYIKIPISPIPFIPHVPQFWYDIPLYRVYFCEIYRCGQVYIYHIIIRNNFCLTDKQINARQSSLHNYYYIL